MKLIAEPWDVGPGGYRLGQFRPPWAEWNDRYRDDVRRFWRGGSRREALADLGWRLTGSQDVFAAAGRRPPRRVNFVTAHDGFTLRDLVSLRRQAQRGERRGQPRRHRQQRSWNHGVEGADRRPRRSPRCAQRAGARLLATLLLSHGHADARRRATSSAARQGGNNNAYCQDNEISWVDWDLEPWQVDLLEWTPVTLNARRHHPTLRQTNFFDGRPVAEGQPKDLEWLRPDGTAMTDAHWNSPGTDCLVMALNGELGERDVDGHPLRDSAFLVVLNRGDDEVPLVLPRTPYGDAYRRLLDTDDKRPTTATKTDKTGSTVRVAPRSVALFRVEST